MPSSRHRYDGYGRPLPVLVDAPRRMPLDAAVNAQQQSCIDALLQEIYATLLVPGVYAEITLIFTIDDGRIQGKMYTNRYEQHHILGKGEP